MTPWSGAGPPTVRPASASPSRQSRMTGPAIATPARTMTVPSALGCRPGRSTSCKTAKKPANSPRSRSPTPVYGIGPSGFSRTLIGGHRGVPRLWCGHPRRRLLLALLGGARGRLGDGRPGRGARQKGADEVARAQARLQEAGFVPVIDAHAHDSVLARQTTDPRSRRRGREDAGDAAVGADPGQATQI